MQSPCGGYAIDRNSGHFDSIVSFTYSDVLEAFQYNINVQDRLTYYQLLNFLSYHSASSTLGLDTLVSFTLFSPPVPQLPH